MSYPGQFWRLVMYGTLYSDIFNCSLTFVPTPLGATTIEEPDTALMEALATKIGDWWNDTSTTAGPGIITSAILQGFKLNRIGADGRYVDATTHEYVYPTPVPGATGSFYPPQLTLVASLRSSVERGPANRGRIYLPPTTSAGTVANDGRTSVVNATNQATAVRRLLVDLNAAINLWDGGGSASPVAGIASNVGAGTFRIISRVEVGRVVDTIRTRRNALDEDYQAAAALP